MAYVNEIESTRESLVAVEETKHQNNQEVCANHHCKRIEEIHYMCNDCAISPLTSLPAVEELMSYVKRTESTIISLDYPFNYLYNYHACKSSENNNGNNCKDNNSDDGNSDCIKSKMENKASKVNNELINSFEEQTVEIVEKATDNIQSRRRWRRMDCACSSEDDGNYDRWHQIASMTTVKHHYTHMLNMPSNNEVDSGLQQHEVKLNENKNGELIHVCSCSSLHNTLREFASQSNIINAAENTNENANVEIIVGSTYQSVQEPLTMDVYEVYIIPTSVMHSSSPEEQFTNAELYDMEDKWSYVDNIISDVNSKNDINANNEIIIECCEEKEKTRYCEHYYELTSMPLKCLSYLNETGLWKRTVCRIPSLMELREKEQVHNNNNNNDKCNTIYKNNNNNNIPYDLYSCNSNNKNINIDCVSVNVNHVVEQECDVCQVTKALSSSSENVDNSEINDFSYGPTYDENSSGCALMNDEMMNTINNNINDGVTTVYASHHTSQIQSFLSSSSQETMSSKSLTSCAASVAVNEHKKNINAHISNSIAFLDKEMCYRTNSVMNMHYNDAEMQQETDSSALLICSVEELLFSNANSHTRTRAMAMSSLIHNNKFYSNHVPVGWTKWATSCEELNRAFIVNLMDEIVQYCHCSHAAFYMAVGLLDHFVGLNQNPEKTTYEFTQVLTRKMEHRQWTVNEQTMLTNVTPLQNNYSSLQHTHVHCEPITNLPQMHNNHCNHRQRTPLYIQETFHQQPQSQHEYYYHEQQQQQQQQQYERFVEGTNCNVNNKFYWNMAIQGKENDYYKYIQPEVTPSAVRTFFTEVIAVCCMLGCKLVDTYPPHVSKVMLCLRTDNLFTVDHFNALELFVLEKVSYNTHSTTLNEVVNTLLDLLTPNFTTTPKSPTTSNFIKATLSHNANHSCFNDEELHYIELAHRWSCSAEEETQRLRRIREWYRQCEHSPCQMYEWKSNNVATSCEQHLEIKEWNFFVSIAKYLCDEVIRGIRITLPVQAQKENGEFEWNTSLVPMPLLEANPCELGIAVIRVAAYLANFELPAVLQKNDNVTCSLTSLCEEQIHDFYIRERYCENNSTANVNRSNPFIDAQTMHFDDINNKSRNLRNRQALLLYFTWLISRTLTPTSKSLNFHVNNNNNNNININTNNNNNNNNNDNYNECYLLNTRIGQLEQNIKECFHQAQAKGVDKILHKRYSPLTAMFKQN